MAKTLTPKQQAWYQDSLAAFARPGNRYNGVTSFTYCSACLGIPTAQVIEDAHAAGVTDRDGDVQRGMASALAKVGSRSATGYTPHPRREERQTFPGYVRDLIRDGGGEADFDAFRALSPISISSLQSPQAQTAAFLFALYEPTDMLFVFPNIKNRHPRGEIGRNILTRDEWLERLRRTGNLGGDCINKNPLTGRQGTSGKGEPSFTSRDCIAAYRFVALEFDYLTLQEQAAFWLGWLSDPKRATTLAALTFSGGKSLHGLIRTGADAITAPTIEKTMRDLLCADLEKRIVNGKTVYPFRADENGLRPHGGTRLAGAVRRDNGNRQQLLFLNPEAVRPTPAKPNVPTAHAEPRRTPTARPAPQTGNHAPEAKERATGAGIGVSAHVSTDRLLARDSDMFMPLPQEPDGNAPLDDLLAYGGVLESMA